MKAFKQTLLLTVLFVSAPFASSYAQDAVYGPEQLEQMTAPIALYPDPLMVQILEAASYPQQVLEAKAWVNSPAYAMMPSEQRAFVLQQEPWDASVKALTSFPPILQTMGDNIGWTDGLGRAFVTQQYEVLSAVQELRHDAEESGHLYTTSQQVVLQQGSNILIEPANADRIYVPAYNPTTVYGVWAAPEYPPYHFSSLGAVAALAVSLAVVRPFWDEHHWDWQHRYVEDRRVGVPHVERETYAAPRRIEQRDESAYVPRTLRYAEPAVTAPQVERQFAPRVAAPVIAHPAAQPEHHQDMREIPQHEQEPAHPSQHENKREDNERDRNHY